MIFKKTYLLRVLAVSLLLAAVIIASACAFLLTFFDQGIGKENFVFSVFYSIAWAAIAIVANAKKLKTLQWFSAVYLGVSALVFLIMLIMSVITSIKLSVGLALVMFLEAVPFCGWSYVIENSIALPAFCLVLTGCMTATVAVPLFKQTNKK